jgi:hypothetical protein
MLIYELDPRDFAVMAKPIGPDKVKRSRSSEYDDAIAMLDGSMYSEASGGNAVVDYLAIDKRTGINFKGKHPTAGITFSVMPNGEIHVDSGSKTTNGFASAVQLYPDLIVHNKVVASAKVNRSRVNRSALCINKAGHLCFATSVGSMYDFSAALLGSGMVYAGYTDGGGSSRLVVGNKVTGSSENRPVALWFTEIDKSRRIHQPSGGNAPGTVSGAASLLSIINPSLSFLFSR